MTPFAESAARLVDVAAGRTPADLVIRGGRWVNVHSGEILPGTDLAVAAVRFAWCGPDAAHCVGPNKQVMEAWGLYFVPGLLRRAMVDQIRGGT
jgi:Adenine deaminase